MLWLCDEANPGFAARALTAAERLGGLKGVGVTSGVPPGGGQPCWGGHGHPGVRCGSCNDIAKRLDADGHAGVEGDAKDVLLPMVTDAFELFRGQREPASSSPPCSSARSDWRAGTTASGSCPRTLLGGRGHELRPTDDPTVLFGRWVALTRGGGDVRAGGVVGVRVPRGMTGRSRRCRQVSSPPRSGIGLAGGRRRDADLAQAESAQVHRGPSREGSG